jgi:lysine 2,3-aminomutase
VEVACHINHPDEISQETIDALLRLRAGGIAVYNQAVLLRGINCDPSTLLDLFWRLRVYGVESYYLFFAGPVRGMDHQRPRIDDALSIKRELRRRASGRCNPRLIVTTRVGKVELGVDGCIVEREADERHVWIRTPYTLEGFRDISPDFVLPDEAVVDDGRIVVRYQDGAPQRA